MESEPLLLACTPGAGLRVAEAADHKLSHAFAAGTAAGALWLVTEGFNTDVDISLTWLRRWARLFFERLCQTRDVAAVTDPDSAVLAEQLAEAPPILGAEYLTVDLLEQLWNDIKGTVAMEVAKTPGGLEEWLRIRHSTWHLVGRVTFHLAENKRSEEFPFAFLATYTDRLSSMGTLQHIPLGRALQVYTTKNDQAALDSLLEPVRRASGESPLISELLGSRRLFQALAWKPNEAYRFIQEIPKLEAAGLIVKLPDWWRSRHPARPQVTVTLDAKKSGGVGIDAMLSFNANVTLDGVKLTDAEWKAIKSSPTGLVSLRGKWVEVNRERLDQVLHHWERVQTAHRLGGLSFHEGMRWLAGFPKTGGTAEELDLDAAHDWSQVVAGKQLTELLDQLRQPVAIDAVPGLKATLRPYQEAGLGWLRFTTGLGLGACLADDMGLGKTLQVIALLCLLRANKKKPSTTLLIVPASLVGNWLAEFSRFAPHLRVLAIHSSTLSRETLDLLDTNPSEVLAGQDAVITTYGMLQRKQSLLDHSWQLAVLDEAQAIKNPATAQARSVKKLQASARIALTGTPIENSLGDLWSIFDFLNPGLLGNASSFADAVKRLANAPRGYAPLRELIHPYLLRRLKTDRKVISDLPEKIDMPAHCALSKKQAMLYGKLVAQLKADLANKDLPENERRGLVLGYLVKFKQVCNHPSHWSGDGRYEAADSGKFVRLTEIASELAERQERCLVFTQFREMTAPLAAHLGAIFKRPGLVLHGGTPVKERARLVETFQQPDGPPFFVLSVKAGGTGLTLTAANHVIHFDRWWNPAVENQATDRAFRIGQRKSVLVHKFVCPGTIEERVDKLIADKQLLAEDLLAGEAGAERLLTQMNNDELLDFVQLDLRAAAI